MYFVQCYFSAINQHFIHENSDNMDNIEWILQQHSVIGLHSIIYCIVSGNINDIATVNLAEMNIHRYKLYTVFAII